MAPTKSGIETRNTKITQQKQVNTSTPTNSGNSSTATTPTTTNDVSILKTLLLKHEILISSNKEILEKVTTMENALQFLSDKYEELKGMYTQVINENKSLKQNHTELISENIKLQDEVQQISTDLNNIKQNTLKNKIVIFGIPNLKDYASIKITFNKIMTALKLNLEDIQIDDIFQKKTKTQQAPLFVTFRNYKNKLDFMQIFKINNIHGNQIGFENHNNKIIIVDQLTELNQTLLKETKILHQHGFKYIWTSNGSVLARRTDISEIYHIKSLNHIETLKQENITI